MMDEKINVLVVDDDLDLLNILCAVIRDFGDYNVISASKPEIALQWLKTEPIGVVITDIMMPEISGLELLEKIRSIDDTISVIMITGQTEPEQMRRAIQLNAFDFIRKPFNVADIQIGIKQAVEKHKLLKQNLRYQHELERQIQIRTGELHAANGKLEKSYLNTIYALINAMEARDIYTKGHSERVTILSLLLAVRLGLSTAELKLIHLGALLHDIGKVGVYDRVLNKSDALTQDEFSMMKQHPIIGDKIITPVGLHKSVHEIILQHHEWVNGCGYPYGIAGEQISSFAKIVSIADAFDAMTSQRCYREDKSRLVAFKEIVSAGNTQFDPDYAQIFYDNRVEIINEFYDRSTIARLLLGKSSTNAYTSITELNLME